MKSRVALRKLSNNDYDTLMSIFQAVFPVKYSLEFLDVWLHRNPDLSFGAELDGKLVGFILVRQLQPYNQQIEFLGVSPSIQKGGIGTSLLQEVIECSNGSTLWLIPVQEDHIINWYRKYGFQEDGEPFISTYTGDIEQKMCKLV